MTICRVLLSTAKGPSLASPIPVNPPPLNATFGIPHVIGSPGFWFGMPIAEITSELPALKVPRELKNAYTQTDVVNQLGVKLRVLDPVYCLYLSEPWFLQDLGLAWKCFVPQLYRPIHCDFDDSMKSILKTIRRGRGWELVCAKLLLRVYWRIVVLQKLDRIGSHRW